MENIMKELYDTAFNTGYKMGLEAAKFTSKSNYNQYEKDIDNIMEHFDFEKVYKVMMFLEWKWVTNSGLRVPDIQEIKTFARDLMTKAVNEMISYDTNEYHTATGGFEVCLNKNKENGKINIQLSFVLSQWDNWD
jgi:hypothetical protein